MGFVVGGKFVLERKLSAGSSSAVYLGTDREFGTEVAVKLEPSPAASPQLHRESLVYGELEGGVGVASVLWFGREARFSVLAMERLGGSLEDLLLDLGRPFSLKTVLMVAEQTLAQVQFLHARGVVHRDLKPDNLLMGLGPRRNVCYVADFGLAGHYRDAATGRHIPFAEGCAPAGNARYASVAAMRGCERSRRDDLESLGYVWVHLLRGALPWQGLRARSLAEKNERILAVKSATTADRLCEGLPAEFASYFEAVARLRFSEEPPYAALRASFRELFRREGFLFDYRYDWTARAPVQRMAQRSILALPLPAAARTQPASTVVSPRESVPVAVARRGRVWPRIGDVRVPMLPSRKFVRP
jgi:serine/threonine protein kinase